MSADAVVAPAAIACHRPRTLDDACRLMAQNPHLMPVAGATDVYPAKATRAGWGMMRHPDVVDLSGLPELRGIADRGDHWWIGAMTTWHEIVTAPLPPLFDGLKTAAREIGGIQIQNRGTIGGNICTASPAGDGIPCLLTLDADVECAGPSVRHVPVADFFTGYRRTAVTGTGELVTGLRIPKRAGRGQFLKLGARRHLVISIAMVAAVFDRDTAGRLTHARIAVGACGPVASSLPALETALLGHAPEPALVLPGHLAHLAPRDDIRASADYRRAAALQLVRDILAEAAGSMSR